MLSLTVFSGLACIINRMDKTEVGIAVDGPLYQFHPLFKDVMVENIPKFLKRDTKVHDC